MEKNRKKEERREGAVITFLSLLILMLLTYIFCDFREDWKESNHLLILNRERMEQCAKALYGNLSEGKQIQAYHNAADAAAFASACGEDAAAELFAEISREILTGANNGRIQAAIDGYLVSGMTPDEVMSYGLPSPTDENGTY